MPYDQVAHRPMKPQRWSPRKGLALAVFLAASLVGTSLDAQTTCLPCAGLSGDEPTALLELFEARQHEPGSIAISWRTQLERPAEDVAALRRAQELGLRPAVVVELDAAPPLATSEALTADVTRLAELAAAAPKGAWFVLDWTGGDDSQELAFLVKRAAVAITGAQVDALVALELPADSAALQELYAEELAAYLDGVYWPPNRPASDDEIEALRFDLIDLDPDALLLVERNVSSDESLGEIARLASAGANLVLIDSAADAESRNVVELVAREFAGELSGDPYSRPRGEAAAWSFVRGEDLALRVVVQPTGDGPLELTFPDPQLGSASMLLPGATEAQPLFGGRRLRNGYELTLEEPPPSFVLRLERQLAASLAGVESVEDVLDVADIRQIPVGEILRRLQAFEDDQARRLKRYTATNTTSLRFQLGTGVQSIDATFEGPFFSHADGGFDWVWETFYVNGVKWRGKRIPEIPLIQPEKATTMPLAITFTNNYRYRLRGTAVVEGRDSWVVDFEPAVAVETGTSLFQGTVWVDREHYGRVKTRAVQLGLEGEVISNEETLFYVPTDRDGQRAAWNRDAFWLPLRLVGQQIFSVLNATTVVEREITLGNVKIDPQDFDARLEAALASDETMIRDTDQGMRYLVVDDETGERVVQEELDQTRFFLVGGAFYDEGMDFPIPLGGLNWLAFDWRDTGTQANLFFAGPLITADIANPSFLGSKFDAGIDLFVFALPFTDTIFRNGVESVREDVESFRPNIDLALGRPLGSFFKLDFEYSLGWNKFSRADDTAEEFVLPENHLNHSFGLVLRYNRAGYRARIGGSHTIRSKWEPWGLPGSDDFLPEHDRYSLYNVSVGKTWHLPKFMKFGIELEHRGGSDLDRFSKYEFGFFSDVSVHGYQGDKVRAEEATAAHLSYGFELGEIFRIDLVGDAAWATDEPSGLDSELLAGVGLVGTFIGPWSTVVNLDIGYALDGPDDGSVTAFIAFLKLFR